MTARTLTSSGTIVAGLLLAIATFAPALQVRAQQNFDEVQIQTVALSDGVYMLVGAGGNMGLSVGADGAFLIDDQFAPLTDKIKAAVMAQTDKPIRFVVNTHWHSDHTGGNENLGDAGAIVVAHENVRTRMTEEHFLAAFNSKVPPSPEGALPVVTFSDAMTFHWNGDDIRVMHVDPAHTDGDAIIHFTSANVLHMGDTYFNGMYPFIDVSTGGNLHGMIAAAAVGLAHSDENTKIIPGHGPLSNRAELEAWRDMLVKVRDRVEPMVSAGRSRDEVVAAKPTADLDAKWGQGFMNPDQWVGIVYDGMASSD